MLQFPPELDEEQQEIWRKKGFVIFDTVMSSIKAVFVIIIVAIGFLLAGDSLAGMLTKIEPVSQKEQEKRLKAAQADDFDRVENGIHVETGLIFSEGFNQVRATCTACHSAKLVTQNRATRQGWEDMIRWMQETQGLWDLGGDEDAILDYLAANYAPKETGRRPGLDVATIEWYELELD